MIDEVRIVPCECCGGNFYSDQVVWVFDPDRHLQVALCADGAPDQCVELLLWEVFAVRKAHGNVGTTALPMRRLACSRRSL